MREYSLVVCSHYKHISRIVPVIKTAYSTFVRKRDFPYVDQEYLGADSAFSLERVGFC